MEAKAISPTGNYLLQIEAREMRMSHWIEAPQLVSKSSGESLLDLSNTLWHLDSAEWLEEEVVRLILRRYPGDQPSGQFSVMVDCRKKIAVIENLTPIPLASLDSKLEDLYEIQKKKG